MKRSSTSAFTLIEMLVVMVVVAILAGLILAINGLVQTKVGKTKAADEIAAMSAACENYKGEHGAYPNSDDTEVLDPRIDGEPRGSAGKIYRDASEDLYKDLSGDHQPDGSPDGKVDGKAYFTFKPAALDFSKNSDGKIQEVNYIQDHFGNPYGYSTAANKDERKYQDQARRDASVSRPIPPRGYNPTFDLWSTGGSISRGGSMDHAKWIKNWAN